MNSSIYQETVFIQATRREKSICALQLQKREKTVWMKDEQRDEQKVK